MTFTELMALDKEPQAPREGATQSKPTPVVEKNSARTERGERSERDDRRKKLERSEQPERPVRVAQSLEIPNQPHKREIKRHSFEFYRDQIDSLRALRVQVMKSGYEASMSAMVREALDDFLKKQG